MSQLRVPFITGSHAYGTPNENSDVDLVVLMDESVMHNIKDLLEIPRIDPKTGYPNPIYAGNLNIIAVHTDLEYDAWQNATNYLKSRRPVSREFAIAYIKEEKRKLRVHGDYPPSKKNSQV